MKGGRRRFLVGTAGFFVALPWLEAISVRANQTTPPQRLVLMYTPNGTIQSAWWPKDVESPTSFTLNTTLAPLEPWKQQLTLLGGVNLAVTDIGPGGPHQRGIGALFTGRELLEGVFTDGCGSHAGYANGQSVDQRIAEEIGRSTLFSSLELGVRATEADVQSRISYLGPGQPLPPINTPLEVFQRLFSSRGLEADETQLLLARRRSVLDAVSQQFSVLKSQVSFEDSQRLERHLELVRDVESRLSAVSASLGCHTPLAPPALVAEEETAMPEILALQLDLLAIAFACDLTRVASLQVSTGLNRIRYPWLDSFGEGHLLSHAGDGDEASNAEIVKRHSWHAQMLGKFMSTLSQVVEGDGHIMDSTAIVWGSDVSRGNAHTLFNMPFCIAGTAGGRIKGGRYLEFPGVPHNRLLVSLLRAYGVADEGFGHPHFAVGELIGLVS